MPSPQAPGGARLAGLDTLEDGLPRTAWLDIDLDRLVGNLVAIRETLPPGTRIEPVVKADAYGHGAVPVARALAAAGVGGLCVATFDEAVELREAGLATSILVLYPIPPRLAPEAARLRLVTTAGDPDLLGRTLAAVADAGPAPDDLRIQLEVETGLGRGGLSPDRLAEAAAMIAATPGVVLAGVWSHLGSPEEDLRSGTQAAVFDEAAALLAADGRVPPRHLAASGGILAGREPLYDAVRLGLSLYGLLPDGVPIAPGRADAAAALRPIMSLRARPVRVALLPTGTGVSYGSSFVTARDSWIATLPVGYGDGWSRAYSNRTSAIVRGRRVPLVGTVAMDAVMADVTDVPGRPVDVDDEFVLLGEQGAESITAAELAGVRGTITWEVVTAMARRLPRVYHSAAGKVAVRTLTRE